MDKSAVQPSGSHDQQPPPTTQPPSSPTDKSTGSSSIQQPPPTTTGQNAGPSNQQPPPTTPKQQSPSTMNQNTGSSAEPLAVVTMQPGSSDQIQHPSLPGTPVPAPKPDTSNPDEKDDIDKIKKETEDAAHDIQTSQGMLTSSKDRAQLTAATAMSVVNVALLRELLDKGPERNAYYTVAISLVSAALILQIIAGLLSLMVANILSYAQKYESNPCRDVRENICPCYCVEARSDGKTGSGKSGSSLEADDPEACVDETARPYRGLGGACCGCCPYDITTNVYPPQEYYVIKKHQHMQHQIVDDKVKNIKITEQLNYQSQLLVTAQSRLEDLLQRMRSNREEDQQAMEVKVRSLQAEIEKGTQELEDFQNSTARYKWRKQQSEELTKLAKQITKKRLLKVVSFWQDIINYIFFIVFILNAFVVGFGVANSNSTASSGASGVTASIPGANSTE